MSEQNSENVVVNDEPENEATEAQPETEAIEPEPVKEEKKRVKITEVIKNPTECNDCKKPMSVKTLRYSHPNVCEKNRAILLINQLKNMHRENQK